MSIPAKANSDQALLAEILNGNIDLYEVIIRRYDRYLYKIGRSYGLNHSDTEDLMQDTFISAYINLEKFENRSSFKTWLVRIMLNNCYQKTHKSDWTKERPMVEGDMERENKIMDGNKAILNAELKQLLEDTMLKIPEKYRMVLSLREVVGLSTSQTAETLEITESNVKVRLSRAKEMMREELNKEYATEDLFAFNLIYCEPLVQRVMKKIKEL